MSSGDWIIFVFGMFATLLLFAGLAYTIREFHEINKHPERFKPKLDLNWLTDESPAPRKAGDIEEKHEASGKS
jgi:hypothetical protein